MTAENRVAIVTGGARGIGEGIAHRLAADGMRVAVLDRDGAAAGRTARELTGPGIGVEVDVRDATAVEAAVTTVTEQLGPVEVLVNNAGIARDNLMFRMTEDEWDDVIDVHLRGTFLMSRAAQRHMVLARAGAIVNVSSTSAIGNRGQANYTAAKSGVIGLTKTMALELGPYGVRVNAIAPGFVATAMSAEAADRIGISHEEFQRRAAEGNASRRVGRPADIAGVVSFLVGPDAAFVNGALIPVAGGPWA
jgi:3-oxoacyl-[acyl-carrier protein] reductase